MNVKISLITISFNAVNSIQRCMDSVFNQTYPHVEYIVIDGNSSDGTRQLISQNAANIHFFKSEPDRGIYDALNKGISYATGDVIGVLHADDYFANPNVLNEIAAFFALNEADLLYADLDYVNGKGKLVRRWRSGNYDRKKFRWGWMPPHPTCYVKRNLFEDWGGYDPVYGTAADYELMLRFMYVKAAKVSYLNKVIVKMTTGGVSNRSLENRVKAWQSDFRAMKDHKLSNPLVGIMLKPLRKVVQFI